MREYPLGGKSEKDLPVPQCFSWVNNGNEGCTEEHTMKNLDFYQWLYDEYGMKLEIYSLDAGNFDSPVEHYFDPENKMYKQNWPEGFKNIAERTKKMGIRLGMWCGPDGFGNTPEEEQKRFEQVVSLCRDYNVALLKFDLVCGPLRTDKQEIFEKTVAECRKYCPDLIVLNHRLELGEAQKYATTFLWGGQETYIDVLINNTKTAPHHRQCELIRGCVPGLQRLTEDHGVCISSAIDYFEDSLVLQAFNRALILSPEIYGTPSLLRDDEFPRLARIYNLSKKYAPLLVDGIELSEKYGVYPVSRGDENTRIITLSNNSWTPLEIEFSISEEIGLGKCEKAHFIQYHPTQRYLGVFDYGASVKITAEPFRAYFCVITSNEPDEILLEDCDYEVVRDLEDKNVKINIVRAETAKVLSKGFKSAKLDGMEVPLDNIRVDKDEYLYAPKRLAKLEDAEIPENVQALAEITLFAVDDDSLEARSRKRAGETEYKEVKAVRYEFFNQESYVIRGCESSYLYDGNEETFYDSSSRQMNRRRHKGCLRLDFGETVSFDRMEIEYFDPDKEDVIIKNWEPKKGDVSKDLNNWTEFNAVDFKVKGKTKFPIALQNVDRVTYEDGVRKIAAYAVEGDFRYIRIPEPMDKIYSIRFFKEGKGLSLKPHTNIVMAPYDAILPRKARKAEIVLPEYKKGSYLSFACDGQHGVEGVYCAMECEGKLYGCEDRAPSYQSHYWQHFVCDCGSNYTYYLNLPEGLEGKKITLWALVTADGEETFDTEIYLCNPNDEKHAATLILERE